MIDSVTRSTDQEGELQLLRLDNLSTARMLSSDQSLFAVPLSALIRAPLAVAYDEEKRDSWLAAVPWSCTK